MAKRVTARQVRQMVEELLTIAPIAERYKELERAVKDGLAELRHTECEVPGKGRVFISQSERVVVPIRLAMSVLKEELANKVIVTKQSVSNDLIAAFVKAGEISDEQRHELLTLADKTPVINLHVRPLK